jgi:K+ potassium transporter
MKSNTLLLLLLCTQTLSPHYAIMAFTGPGGFAAGWLSLSAILLCVTGAEAMYADLGHFSSQAVVVSTYTPLGARAHCHSVSLVDDAAQMTRRPCLWLV